LTLREGDALVVSRERSERFVVFVSDGEVNEETFYRWAYGEAKTDPEFFLARGIALPENLPQEWIGLLVETLVGMHFKSIGSGQLESVSPPTGGGNYSLNERMYVLEELDYLGKPAIGHRNRLLAQAAAMQAAARAILVKKNRAFLNECSDSLKDGLREAARKRNFSELSDERLLAWNRSAVRFVKGWRYLDSH